MPPVIRKRLIAEGYANPECLKMLEQEDKIKKKSGISEYTAVLPPKEAIPADSTTK
jgi:hypothetical protein